MDVEPVAVVLAFVGDGAVAVTRPEGGFALPGGHVEPGESFEQGARRELLEETGLYAPVLRPLCRQRIGKRDVVGFYAPELIGQLRSSPEGFTRVVSMDKIVRGPYGSFAARCVAQSSLPSAPRVGSGMM